jgi:hypothetical protein
MGMLFVPQGVLAVVAIALGVIATGEASTHGLPRREGIGGAVIGVAAALITVWEVLAALR